MARPKPLAEFLEPCLGKAIAAQGFTGADLLVSWPEIVGERLGAASQPIRVEWPRRLPGERDDRRQPATLIVRVEGAFALELQHLAPLVMERVNAFYGWRCVGRIVLKQAPVGRMRAERAPPPAPSPAAQAKVAEAVAPVEAELLRAALARLGNAVLATADEGEAGRPGTSLPHFS
jgi:hypothetical protein